MKLSANEITEQIKSKINSVSDINEIVFIDYSLDHNKDIKQSKKIKVVFGEEAFFKITSLMYKTIDDDEIEYGAFFSGNIYDDIIYINDYTSDFSHRNGMYNRGNIFITNENLCELDKKIEKTINNQTPNDVVIHFSTHPLHVRNQYGKVNSYYSSLYSNQELYTYANLQKNMQPVTDNKIMYLGAMIAINNNQPQISCIYFDEVEEEFVNLMDLYYIYDNCINKLNRNDLFNVEKITKEECKKLEKIR